MNLSIILGYGLATAAQAAAALIVVPIITRLLGADSYGQWTLVEPLLYLTAQFSLLGANIGILKLVGENKWSHVNAFFALLKPSCLSLMLFCTALAVIVGRISQNGGLALAAGSLSFFEGVLLLALSSMRAINASRTYSAIIGAKAVLIVMTLMTYKFSARALDVGVTPILILLHIPVLVCLSAALLSLGRPSPRTSNLLHRADAYRDAVKYGWPIACSALFGAIVAIGDRYIMSIWQPIARVGEYVVTAKLASILSLAIAPVGLWLPAARYRHLQTADRGAIFFKEFALGATVLLLGIALCAWTAAPALIPILNPGQISNEYVAGALLAAAFFTGITTFYNIGLLTTGKTNQMFFSSVIVGLTQIAMLAALVPLLGSVGAASATMASSAIAFTLQYKLSQKYFAITYNLIVPTGTAILSIIVIYVLREVGYSIWMQTIIFTTFYVIAASVILRGVLRKPWR